MSGARAKNILCAVLEWLRRPRPLELLVVKRHELSPGDVLVLKCLVRLNEESRIRLRKDAELAFPGFRVAVLEDGMDILIVARSALEKPAQDEAGDGKRDRDELSPFTRAKSQNRAGGAS